MFGQRQGEGKEIVQSKLKKEVDEMEDDLRQQTQMNGISLSSCIRKTLGSSKRTVLIQSLTDVLPVNILISV